MASTRLPSTRSPIDRFTRTLRTASGAGVALLALQAPAAAQTPVEAPRASPEARHDETVVFGDDLLGASAMGADGGRIAAGLRVARMGLVRPRLHFVNEILKSVENL